MKLNLNYIKLNILILFISYSIVSAQIINGGFENGKEAWSSWDINNNGEFTIVSSPVFEGDSACAIFKSGFNYIGIKNDVLDIIKKAGNTKYELKANLYYPVEFSDKGKVDIRLEYVDDNSPDGKTTNVYFFGTKKAGESNKGEWLSFGSKKDLTFSNVTKANIVAYTYGGDGTAPFYIDGIEFNAEIIEPQPTIPELDSSFTGEYLWDESNGVVEFTKSGEFKFVDPEDEYKFFIWKVPTYVKTILIDDSVTITGAFHSFADLTIKGKNRKTSIVYGTDEQRWADNRNLDEWYYCQFQAFGGTLNIENLTSLDPFSYHVRGWGPVIHAKKVDFIDDRGGSGNHSDGFTGGDGSTVDSCYFQTGDDVIKVYFDITVTNTEINMIQNSVPIQFGWGNYGSGAKGVFKNVNIHGMSGRGPDNRIISGRAGNYDKSIQLFDCVINNTTSSLFSFYEEGQYIDVYMMNSDISVKNFISQTKGKSDIFINGKYYDYSTTKTKWVSPDRTPDTVAPVVSITEYTEKVNYGDTLKVSASVIDNLDEIYRADLYLDGKKAASIKEAPFVFKLTTFSKGKHIIYVVGTDSDLNDGRSDSVEVEVLSASKQLPYNGTPFEIPTLIEAEQFDIGGEGVSYHDVDAGRNGGDNTYRIDDAPDVEFGPWGASGGNSIAWYAGGEWHEYSVNAKISGEYKFSVGYSSPNDSNSILIYIDDELQDSIMFNKNSESWNENWTTSEESVNIELTAGTHIIKTENNYGGFNYDYLLIDLVTDIEDEFSIPSEFVLNQNYPNPFNPTTTISFSIPNSEFVNLSIYNLTGEEIKTLINRKLSSGNYNIQFDASNIPSGVYFYRLSSGSKILTKKMLLLK